jgi:putative MATE family efflux protein
MTDYTQYKGAKKIYAFIKQALTSGEQDYTKGSIRTAVLLLAIPMILEMMLESVFGVVDIFFVGRISNEAVTAVGLTESVLTIVYSIGMGLSMAATALVARRIGEKDAVAASKAAAQSILFALVVTFFISVAGVIFAPGILRVMGAIPSVVAEGAIFTRIIFGGSLFIMLLFLINGIFRGAGDASLAMQSLWIANTLNIILCPMLINGWGPFPRLGIEGAAVATTIGRSMGVIYQVYKLAAKKGTLRIQLKQFIPDWMLLKSIFDLAWGGALQFLIGSASWIFLATIIAGYGDPAIYAGYQVAIRLILFFLLPAWGMSNAVATLVGQNLGAKQPERAEKSAWKAARYNVVFMLMVSVFFYFGSTPLVEFMNKDAGAQKYAIMALRTVSLGYIFYGLGMVMMNAFNGAGDTKTPTAINLVCFWAFQIPFAWLLTSHWKLGPQGVFIAIVVTETLVCIVSTVMFVRGKWKIVMV